MIRGQIALLQRELWEHRSIYIAPAVVAFLVSLLVLTGSISMNGHEFIDIGIVGASNLPENARAAALTGIVFGLWFPFILVLCVLAIFYSLDSLYAERKDRSILFWRSIPSTDFETVLSKLLIALLVIPLVTFAMILVTHLVVLLITSVWVGFRGGNAFQLIWGSARFFDDWTATLLVLLALPLWLSPFVGWFLFVSAYTKRSAFLTAFLPIAVVPMIERMIFGTGVFAEAFFERTFRLPLFSDFEAVERMFEDGEDFVSLGDTELSLLGLMDLGGFLTHPGLWLGLIVCGLFTAAAIYVRRYRDDS
jgi:ABC-2 type transport system permease protein